MGTTYTHVISTAVDNFASTIIAGQPRNWGAQRHRIVINRPATIIENPMRKFHASS